MKRFICLSLIVISIGGVFSGCTTTTEKIQRSRPPDIALKNETPYVNDTADLDNRMVETATSLKSSLKYGMADPSGKVALTEDKTKATYVLLTTENYAKVGDIIVLAGAYKKLLDDNTRLVNCYILEKNKLNEIISLERYRSQIITDAWAGSEEMYLDEKSQRTKENLFNKILLLGTNALWVAIVAAGL